MGWFPEKPWKRTACMADKGAAALGRGQLRMRLLLLLCLPPEIEHQLVPVGNIILRWLGSAARGDRHACMPRYSGRTA
eukprot:scaffold5561_cov131-Isochrysis_galbana.AAC.2